MASKSSDWRPGPTVCRCCFTEGCYKDISTEYFWMGKREVYSEMLHETFDVSIAYSVASGPNSNSRLICEPCISRLRDASDFKRQVKECEKTFMQHLDPGSTMELELQVETTDDKSVKLELVKEEQKLSDDEFDDRTGFQDDDDDDDDLDDEPLTTLASKIPKKESVDLSDLLDNAKAEKRKSTAKVKASPAKKPKKKDVPKPSASKAPAPKVEKKKKESTRGQELDTVKNNAVTILKHSTAYPLKINYTTINCYFCQEIFTDPCLFRLHMDTKHESLDRSTLKTQKLNTHIRVDIKNLRCKSCVKIFPSLESIAGHFIEEHGFNIDTTVSFGLVQMKLEKERFECVRCPKKFSGMLQLSRHAGTHVLRFMCETCGKSYETNTGIRAHQLKCNTNQFMCRYCKQTFPSASARNEHRRTSKSCHPVKCNMCSERFLYWDKKQEHLVLVHGMDKKVFRCTACNEEFARRIHLYFHFKSTHTQDLKCQFCPMTFKQYRYLEEHLRRTHTGDRPWQCSVCDKKFVSKSSLNKHLVIHDDSKKSACPACDRLFVKKQRLRDHVSMHHPDLFNRLFSVNA